MINLYYISNVSLYHFKGEKTMYTKINELPTELLLTLIEKAKQRYTLLFPCMHNKFLFECFTIENIKNEVFLYFWYNDVFNSTHIEKIKIDEKILKNTCF